MQILINWFPLFILIGLWVFFMRQMQGGAGGRGAMSFGKSRARMLSEDQVKVTFNDVAGADEAKEEVGEIVDFLREPAKFQKLGGKIPKGVLMVGPPGTGKTLLARRWPAKPGYPISPSVAPTSWRCSWAWAPRRVRDMFEQAKKHAPCIVFIDELDAVGSRRGAGLGDGHDDASKPSTSCWWRWTASTERHGHRRHQPAGRCWTRPCCALVASIARWWWHSRHERARAS